MNKNANNEINPIIGGVKSENNNQSELQVENRNQNVSGFNNPYPKIDSKIKSYEENLDN